MYDRVDFFTKVKGDYWLLSGFIGFISYFIFGAVMIWLGEEQIIVGFVVYGFAFIALILMLVRLKTIDRILESRIEINAIVTKKHIWSRYPHIKVEYSYNGELIHKKINVFRTKKSKSINVGDNLVLYIDETNFKRVLIKKLFFNTDEYNWN